MENEVVSSFAYWVVNKFMLSVCSFCCRAFLPIFMCLLFMFVTNCIFFFFSCVAETYLILYSELQHVGFGATIPHNGVDDDIGHWCGFTVRTASLLRTISFGVPICSSVFLLRCCFLLGDWVWEFEGEFFIVRKNDESIIDVKRNKEQCGEWIMVCPKKRC